MWRNRNEQSIRAASRNLLLRAARETSLRPGPCFTNWIYSWRVFTVLADGLTKSMYQSAWTNQPISVDQSAYMDFVSPSADAVNTPQEYIHLVKQGRWRLRMICFRTTTGRFLFFPLVRKPLLVSVQLLSLIVCQTVVFYFFFQNVKYTSKMASATCVQKWHFFAHPVHVPMFKKLLKQIASNERLNGFIKIAFLLMHRWSILFVDINS